MREADSKIVFRDWLPDLPDLDNPGMTVATNCQWIDGTYQNFNQLTALAINGVTIDALPGRPVGTIYASAGGTPTIYAAAEVTTGGIVLYGRNTFGFTGDGGAWTASSATLGTSIARFAQFDSLVIAALGDAAVLTMYITAGSSSGFVTLGSASGTAPGANCVGVINRFVVLAQANSTPVLQWSGINNPTSWPTANSATAIAQQAGVQTLNAAFGPITGVVGGDQYGLVLQLNAITRMTYIGGSAVFQFDTIDRLNGCAFADSIVQATNGLNYFAGNAGFFATDGVTVKDISKNKVASFFSENKVNVQANIYGALDDVKRLIYWGFKTSGAATDAESNILIYNYEEDKWSVANQTHYNLCNAGAYASTNFDTYQLAYGSAFTLSSFDGSVGSAVLTTGEFEPSLGGYSRVQGIKPQIDASANAVTVAIGTRNDQFTTPSYTSEITANSRSGFCDFRSEGRYHRARVTITGTFNAAQGIEPQIEPSGPV